MRPERTDPWKLQLVLSSAALAISAPGAVIFALLNLPQFVVVALSLLAALALINVLGVVTAIRPHVSHAPDHGGRRFQ